MAYKLDTQGYFLIIRDTADGDKIIDRFPKGAVNIRDNEDTIDILDNNDKFHDLTGLNAENTVDNLGVAFADIAAILNWLTSVAGVGFKAASGGSGAGTPVETLNSHAELRALTTGTYEHELVAVKDYSYVFNSITYFTKGGVYRQVSNGTENGATLIVDASGRKWALDWDGVTVFPEMFVVGGYDSRGRVYVDKNVISDLAQPANDFIFHDGIYNDRDRIQNAIDLVGLSKLFHLNLGTNKEYLIDKALSCYSLLLQDRNGIIEGNHATLKRSDSPLTTTASWALTASTTITLADASNYRVGQNICVLNTAKPNGGFGYNEFKLYAITGISGNIASVKFLTGDTSSIASPAPVILETTLLENKGYTGEITVQNLNVNGNKLNGGAGTRYTKDWRFNNGLKLGTGVDKFLVQNCKFWDAPSENVMGTFGAMRDCSGVNLDGSFYHYSMSTPSHSLANRLKGVVIDSCFVDGVCLSTDAVSDHCEAVITPSLYCEYVKIVNCTFKNGAEWIFQFDPITANTDQKYVISNNVFENFKSIVKQINGVAGFDNRSDGLSITGNTFYNCGDMVFYDKGTLKNVYTGYSFNDININSNIFVGSRFYFNSCTNLNFQNNKVLFRDELACTYPDFGRAEIDSNPPLSAITFSKCQKFKFTGNTVENQRTDNEKLSVGVYVPFVDLKIMKDGSGVNTNTYYEQGMDISDNAILGFHYGINCYDRPSRTLGAIGSCFQTLGWQIANNTIVLSNLTPTMTYTHCGGISALAGTNVHNNMIYKQRTDVKQFGILAVNPDPRPATTTSVLGVIVTSNKIYSDATTVAISTDNFGSTERNYNCIVRDNIYMGTTQGSNAARNFFANNQVMNVASFTPIVPPLFQTFEWNTVNY